MKFDGISPATAAGGRRRSRLCRDAIRDVERVIRKKGGGGGGGGGGRRSCQRRPRRRVEASSAAIQSLFLACKSVFKGPAPSPLPPTLASISDKMRSEDVDLSADIPFFKAKTAGEGAPGVTYTTIYQCRNFSICIFFLRPAAVIPLHDHPDMTVFSKLLLGSMHVRSYDFVDPADPAAAAAAAAPPSPQKRRLARLKVDADLSAPCGASVLFPAAGGNIHAFTAVTPAPSWTSWGRHIPRRTTGTSPTTETFPFPVSRGGAGEEGVYRWLEETGVPEEAAMTLVEYLGPPILDV
ncbi:unnamed protein product [Spirodela intermedia]|uniref:cysteine dioxygenase n=1 Tax=Spirodela intermedia TaxID=51605 RepID=A0A7I8IKS8_SPIIN|nr:unnamed protein product [Spirodela intermedia]CAA6658494.1 unnamed protein product [Spirodela intermedia]